MHLLPTFGSCLKNSTLQQMLLFHTKAHMYPLHKVRLFPAVLANTHTQSFYCSSGICPGPPGWAGTRKVKTRKVKPIWIYCSKRQWVAVASAGQYASLQQMPLPLTVSCSSKSRLVLPSWFWPTIIHICLATVYWFLLNQSFILELL